MTLGSPSEERVRSDAFRYFVEDWWERIDGVVSDALGIDALGEPTSLGHGAWGHVYPTLFKEWVIKVSIDPTEGPVNQTVLETPELRVNPGIAWVEGVWRLAEEFDGLVPYVILRENIRPWTDTQIYANDILSTKLNLTAMAAERLNEAIYLDRQGAARPGYLKKMEMQFFEEIGGLEDYKSGRPAADLAAFMDSWYAIVGGALADITSTNVGNRMNDLPVEPGHEADPVRLVAFDIGHSNVETHVHVPLVANPGRIPVIRW